MSGRARVLCLLAVIVAASSVASLARADGDPGSDVLVFQNLFVGSDAGLSVRQQAQFGGLLQNAAGAGFPIRVAIIASRSDLGAVTALWGAPRSYARFLGIELSLAYTQRLLVVMPNGFGFNWPGHSSAAAYALLARIPIRSGGSGLLAAAQSAVRGLAASSGVSLDASRTTAAAANQASGQAAIPAGISTTTTAPRVSGGSDDSIAIIAAALAALAICLTAVFVFRRRRDPRRARASSPLGPKQRSSSYPRRWLVPGFALMSCVAVGASAVAIVLLLGASSTAQSDALAANPELDPGTALNQPAPDFTLSNQFGQPVSLHSFRGKVVLLAFNDSECTTLCPLTTTAMVDAKAMLGAAGSQVELVGIDANPAAISLEDVWSYSELHGVLHEWDFLTGSLAQLRRVWKAYAVEAQIQRGLISHSPALFVIGPNGSEAKVYVTQQSYAAVGQLGQLLAQEASSLLVDHPRVNSDLSYSHVTGLSPAASLALPRAGGGTVAVGPNRSGRLFVFFATWDQEITSLAGQLQALDGYESAAAASGLPELTAVDEGTVEPSSAALRRFLGTLAHPLSYPVAIDQSGRVADGYQVEGVPWFVLTSPSGQILWYWEVDTSGWLSRSELVQHVRAALARALGTSATPAAVAHELAGSPAPLASLHQQAGQLLGSEPELAARIRALRGFPVVVNAWASWCTPCRSEFGLFASASALYGRRVAFVGADTGDSASDARAFLAQHPISYPSYQATTSDLGSLAVIEGLPTTIFIDRAGRVVYVHTGQYDSQGTLDEDIGSYALGG
jgi:cytochrome oxidase Cu insertion factor (SCO1/SenC/PrrC family)/thiol-disulfide isomerase/thioredoxin